MQGRLLYLYRLWGRCDCNWEPELQVLLQDGPCHRWPCIYCLNLWLVLPKVQLLYWQVQLLHKSFVVTNLQHKMQIISNGCSDNCKCATLHRFTRRQIATGAECCRARSTAQLFCTSTKSPCTRAQWINTSCLALCRLLLSVFLTIKPGECCLVSK